MPETMGVNLTNSIQLLVHRKTRDRRSYLMPTGNNGTKPGGRHSIEKIRSPQIGDIEKEGVCYQIKEP